MILVTGATGCLGRNVVSHLARGGYDVRALVSPDARAEVADVRAMGARSHVVADVRDAEGVRAAVRGVDAVVHLAGIAGVAVRSAAEMMSVNRDGARTVADACLAARIRLVHVSSASAVGLSPKSVIDEAFEYESVPVRHPYPVSKRAGESQVLAAVGAGLDAVVLNPAAVLAGGGRPGSTWSGLPDAIRRGGFRVAPPGGFGFCSASTLVSAVESALVHGEVGERYLLVDQNLEYAELLEEVARMVGVRGPVAVLPGALLHGMVLLAAPLRSVLSRHPRPIPTTASALPFLTWKVRYRGDRARGALGISQQSTGSLLSQFVRPKDVDPLAHPFRHQN